MAHLTKTPAGTWKATIRRHGWPTVVKTFRLKRDAEDWARKTEDEIIRGVFINRKSSEKMTMRDALARYLDEITPRKKPTTQRRDHTTAKRLLDHFGAYSLAAVSPELISQYRDMRLKAGLANDTVRIELNLLSNLFNIAIKEWNIGLPQNPLSQIYKPKQGKGRDRRLEPEEEALILDAVLAHSNPMLRWIVCLAIETGMRKGELVGLKRKQIHLKDRYVMLPDTKNDSPRPVPLSRNATELFRQALNNPVRPADTDLLFFGNPGRDGLRRPYEYDKVWQGIKKKLGIENLRFHDLRHETVSRLIEAGMSDQSVSAISGHKSMQMLKRYAHLRAKRLVNQLDEIEDNGRVG